MRLIKLLLISLVVLFLVVTAISLFIPAHIRVSRAVNIAAPFDTVYRQLAETSNWGNWLLPAEDPSVHIQYADDGRSVLLNDNKMEITETGKEEIKIAMSSPGQPAIHSGWKMMHIGQKDSLTVQWYMDMNLAWYPWEKFRSLLFDKMYGTRMERGLAALKKYAENRSPGN